MKKFNELGISASILKAITEEKFDEPTLIQEKAIPVILAGKDLIAGSATGSGKTLAFASGIIDRCEPKRSVQALVLTPTRELAEQVAKSIGKFSKHKPLKIMAVYGGVSINPQIKFLRDADVVIGTPGRILDHLERRTIDLSKVSILVLDEADRMLDMGFLQHVERIIRTCPKNRQTLLFSATITGDVERLSRNYMQSPVKISAGVAVDPSKLRQEYYNVEDSMKYSLLVHLLKNEKAGLVMVFCNSRNSADFVANNLVKDGIDAVAIHGGFSQERRTRVLQDFHSQKASVMVCTDVAARGLDINDVSHVYNYDIPRDSKDYIHRIGRTARAGKEGKAVSLLVSKDYENFSRVQHNRDLRIVKMNTPAFERIQIKWTPNRGRGGFSRGGGDRGGSGFRRGGEGGFRRNEGSFGRGREGGFRSNDGGAFKRSGDGFRKSEGGGFGRSHTGGNFRHSEGFKRSDGGFRQSDNGGFKRSDGGFRSGFGGDSRDRKSGNNKYTRPRNY